MAEACGQTGRPGPVLPAPAGAEEGLFTRDGTGRDARFLATEQGMAALGTNLERHRLAYVQDHAGRGWDRRWRLVAFAIPEQRRAARDAFRDRLLASAARPSPTGCTCRPTGGRRTSAARPSGSAWPTPSRRRRPTTSSVGGVPDPRELARRLWPIDELADALPAVRRDVRRRARRARANARAPRAAGRRRVPARRARASPSSSRRCFADDPLLPPELLPRPWPGRAARELLVRSRRLALLLREQHNRPALFRSFDDLIESIP